MTPDKFAYLFDMGLSFMFGVIVTLLAVLWRHNRK
jgi:hypothetical protein